MLSRAHAAVLLVVSACLFVSVTASTTSCKGNAGLSRFVHRHSLDCPEARVTAPHAAWCAKPACKQLLSRVSDHAAKCTDGELDGWQDYQTILGICGRKAMRQGFRSSVDRRRGMSNAGLFDPQAMKMDELKRMILQKKKEE
ncbi:hypothetical protein Ae201684P_001285 [Aphanomyces euteiches]|uniref:TAZ-type domain-containing protein n=1 Tax=Aphanomyces euteiches TaxID=100861 RepID=A0A6G0WGN4_9STRA|nr:hypothetical protein Ae201684_015406 [Aphanomyces euteiches]KAH9097810.1 hypothetical protein Ae201684P_001285 [Aphanomyces euteiches]